MLTVERVIRAVVHRLAFRSPPEWTDLRRALERERRGPGIGSDEVALARELRQLKQETLAATGPVRCCAECALGRPLPHGRFAGGFCCGAETGELFTPAELCALALAGTTARHLRPRPALAGCLFRGPGGCVLPPRHRPTVCVAHLCRDLEHELVRRGRLDRVLALSDGLRGRFDAFAELRLRRLDRGLLDRLLRGDPP